ncbi:MAG: D-aminoacyl-tRNA deacylase [Myxococcales bacterium]|nr:D-aminoacyl-tRNA deacylase [Myxococcales bacterium]
MRAVVQRVTRAHVAVDGQTVGSIERGLLVYLGAARGDSKRDVDWMAHKIATLRIFPDTDGKMSLDVGEVEGQVLVVSQFTLFGDVRKGRRPSFERAGEPTAAAADYEAVCGKLRELGLGVATGRFRAMMAVHCVVDGPVTILVDSEKSF